MEKFSKVWSLVCTFEILSFELALLLFFTLIRFTLYYTSVLRYCPNKANHFLYHDVKNRARPGPSLFVSGLKYFPSRTVLNVTGDVTC